MTHDEAFALISDCLDRVASGKGQGITPSTDLIADNVLDSLDVMSFLFELEQVLGHKLEAVTDEYDDFRVSSLQKLIVESRTGA